MNTFLENYDLDKAATVFGRALQMGYALSSPCQACLRSTPAANAAKREKG
jgi:hypothetical protein